MFPGVKVREYCGVGGKCQVCADLKGLRRSVHGYALQEGVTALIGYHRAGCLILSYAPLVSIMSFTYKALCVITIIQVI